MNTGLFKTTKGRLLPSTDTVNEAGGTAYKYDDAHALAQLAVTGTFGNTYYETGEKQLDRVLELCQKLAPEYVGQVAVYAAENGYMKDMPAFLTAHLLAASVKDAKAGEVLEKVFPRVITNGRMLRGFVQFVRSGVTGRKSFGSRGKRLIRQWLERRSDNALFRDTIGNNPSMADIIKMVHPKPMRPERQALYGRIIGRPGVSLQEFDQLPQKDRQRSFIQEHLPTLVQEFDAFKKDTSRRPVPDVPFRMLDSLGIGPDVWVEIARRAPWHMTRMNLNTFKRHGVFDTEGLTEIIATRLKDTEQIAKSKVFPYQLLVAYQNATDIPHAVKEALQDAMEAATANVPVMGGHVYVCPDVSMSMHSSITGRHQNREGRLVTPSKVQCIDVASLVSACVLRTNRQAKVIPFSDRINDVTLNPRDSVMTNTGILRRLPSGGTNVSLPLAKINAENAFVDLVIIVSDYESWMDSEGAHFGWGYVGWGYVGWGNTRRTSGPKQPSQTMVEWEKIKRRNPKARLVCLDVTPTGMTQAAIHRDDILNIGGWSDKCFDVIASFAAGDYGKGGTWVHRVQDIQL